jgi:hypothetical protein
MYTGAPGEQTCHFCHSQYPLNSGPGTLTITAPSEFVAGQTYQIMVGLQQTSRLRWGFEFTPLNQGTCTVTDPTNTQQSSSGSNTYVKHTLQGTYSGDPGPVSWSFDWTAPASPPQTVTFYAAGNAADGGGSANNDYIYTTSATSQLADTQPPNPIGDLTIRDLTGDIVLTWTNPGDNVGVVDYRVYRAQQAYFAPSGIPIATVVTTTWTDTGAAGNPAVNYFYNVRARDAATNEGDPSNYVGEVDFSTDQ